MRRRRHFSRINGFSFVDFHYTRSVFYYIISPPQLEAFPFLRVSLVPFYSLTYNTKFRIRNGIG